MIPKQTEGVSKELHHHIAMETMDDADEMFVVAKNRLLDVNHWQLTAASESASFCLTDNKGHELRRKAHLGDYIKINIPGPGNSTGDGFDWVHIEEITYDDYPDEDTENIGMMLRPCKAPGSVTEDVAHFFDDTATSSFIIERKGLELNAWYFGRNEKPNTSTDSVVDNARNLLVSAGAILGLSDAQWNSLVKGFLKTED